jgi:HSP20 family protein
MVFETKQDVPVTKSTEIQRPLARRMMSPFDEMDHLFERLLPRGWMRPSLWESPVLSELAEPLEIRTPRMDLIDGEDNVVVRAEVPGVDKKDLEVSVNDNSVTIKGKSMREAKEEKGDYYRCEIGSSEFSRSFSLPCAVDASKASAHLKDGMLELTLPKIEKAKKHAVKID